MHSIYATVLESYQVNSICGFNSSMRYQTDRKDNLDSREKFFILDTFQCNDKI